MPAHPVKAHLLPILEAHPNAEGQAWTAKTLQAVGLGGNSLCHGLLQLEKGSPWLPDRLTKFKEYLEKEIPKLNSRLDRAKVSNNPGTIEMIGKRIKDQQTIIKGIEDALLMDPMPVYTSRARRRIADIATLPTVAPGVNPSHTFDCTDSESSQPLLALLASDFLRHGEIKRLEKVVATKSTAQTMKLCNEMQRRCKYMKAGLEVLSMALHDAGDRLLTTPRTRPYQSEFGIRGTIYLLVPPRPGDCVGSYRLCQIARHATVEATAQNERLRMTSLSTNSSDDFVAIRAIKNDEFCIDDGRDQGTQRPWRTQLVVAHPIRVPDAQITHAAAGVVTMDLIVKRKASEALADKLVKALGWDDHSRMINSKLKSTLGEFAKLASKVLVTDGPRFEG